MVDIPDPLKSRPLVEYASQTYRFGLAITVTALVIVSIFAVVVLVKALCVPHLHTILINMFLLLLAEFIIVGSFSAKYLVLALTEGDAVFSMVYFTTGIGVGLWSYSSLKLLCHFDRLPPGERRVFRAYAMVTALTAVLLILSGVVYSFSDNTDHVRIFEASVAVAAFGAVGSYAAALRKERNRTTSELSKIRLGYLIFAQIMQLGMASCFGLSRSLIVKFELIDLGETIMFLGASISAVGVTIATYWSFFIPERVRIKHQISRQRYSRFHFGPQDECSQEQSQTAD